jgi:hypothetical protein
VDVLSGRVRGVDQSERPRRSQPTVLLWILGGLVALTLVVGAVAGALRAPTLLDPDSPEGVTQAYLQAVLDHRHADASAYFSAATAARCSARDFRSAWVPESLTATLDGVRVEDGRAEVSVRIRSVAGPGPFGGGDYSSLEVFSLVEEDAGWRLSGEPWPLPFCERRP